MMKALAAFIILMLATAYYFFFYPPVLLERKTAAALDQFTAAIETKDRAKIGETLKTLLSDDAKIRLEISFFSITQSNNPPLVQDFDKEQFLSFIDNTLYPLTDYGYYNVLKSFVPAADRQSAQVFFSSHEWGDGKNYYGGTAVAMRFSSATDCDGTVTFAGTGVQLRNVICKLQFRAVPKPEELGKIQGNADAMREFLTKP